jgi:hypothetical protein
MSEAEAMTLDATAQSIVDQVWSDSTSGPGVSTEAPANDNGPEGTPPANDNADEPAKAPEAERVSARILAAKRAEIRAAKERAELASQRAEVESQRTAIAEQAAQVEALKAAKLSPSKALELLGMSPKEFIESLATEHEPATVARRAVGETQTEIQKLRAELQEMRDAAQAREKAIRDQETARDYDAATVEFLDFVGKNHTKYETLVADFSDAEIAQAAKSCLDEHVGKDSNGRPVTRLRAFMAEHDGRPPSDDEIAEFLEHRAAQRRQSRSAWHQRVGLGAQPSQGAPNGQTAATQTDRGPGPRTLTSREASVRASADKPWSQESADEESLRILAAAMRAG